jgi:hypothetical protein
MADANNQPGGTATREPAGTDTSEPAGTATSEPGGTATSEQPSLQDDRSESAQRAAYEAELNRITSSEMILQTAVSLLNIGGRRLGLAPAAPGTPAAERDLEQVRDAIDGASALMPILERSMSGELGPLRDAIAQLQFAYAREAQGGGEGAKAPTAQTPPAPATQAPPETPAAPTTGEQPTGATPEPGQSPGPAQASGRLWVPGR